MAIDILPDELLLEIFAYYVQESQERDAWHMLAFVCQRWRGIALGSPHRLNIRILCSEGTPVRKNLESWPPFPIVLTADYCRELGEDNILATLEQCDRICHVEIWNISKSLWEKVLPLMQKSFPILTDLRLHLQYKDNMASVVPESFLGGSAQRLRKLTLEGIPFPGLPKLLLSTTDLVNLDVHDIPHSSSGYISPDAITTLTKLESLKIIFKSPQPHPEWERRRTSPQTRTLLPSLTLFTFQGTSGYLEDIVDRIDAPLLDRLRICFFQRTIFDAPQLAQFISRVPKFQACDEARVHLSSSSALVRVLSRSKTGYNATLQFEYSYRHPDLDSQLSPLVQLCTSSLPQALIPMVERLTIVRSSFYMLPEQDNINSSLLREVLRPFTGVKDLYLSSGITPHIALALQGLVGEGVTELMPILQSIFLEEVRRVPEGIRQLVAARQLSSHLISVFLWERTSLLLLRATAL